MNVLITGASGFIGFHLALYLKSLKKKVIGYDNFNAYYDQKLKYEREKILNQNGIDVIHADINETSFLKSILLENKITHLVHLAAQAGVRHSFFHPEEYISSNLGGFISVLEACKNLSNIKIIYASSSSVYGENKKIPFSINDATDNPTSLYGATKKANELIAYSYHHLYNLPLIGLRYFTVYGPWGRPDMAYYKFTKHIIEEKPIDIYNHGEMARDFTYIDDIVQGTAQALNLDEKYKILNLGHNSPIKLMDFIQLLESKLKKKAIKNMLPLQKGEVIQTYADIEESKKLLNFFPTISFEKGLSKFLDWYKQYHQIDI